MNQCHVCYAYIPEGREEAHLKQAHPMPEGGFRFYLDMRPFTWHRPSELVGVLKQRFAPDSLMEMFHQELDNGKKIELNDGNAVDLTHTPYFYLVPHATYLTR